MRFEYSYILEDGLEILAALISGLPITALNIATYVLGAIALYTLAKNRGLRHGWLAWIPVANCWILGSLSDQYRYVVRGEVRVKRKSLLILSIILSGLITALVSLAVAAGVTMAMCRPGTMAGLFVALGCLGLATAVVSVIRLVIRTLALGDLYRSMDPDNGTLFLVLSILFPVTEAFFLFFNRKKELGMPPRREKPPVEEPIWHQETFGDF